MIVVTGASRGLGRALCERLLQSGEEVFGLARQVGGLPFPALACDVASHTDVRVAAQHLRAQGVAVTALVNAAGIAAMNLALTTPPAKVRQIVEVNLLGTIFCCQQFAPLMVRRKAGTIINFSTIAVALGLKGESVYAASKAGVEGFTRAFAREMADFGITVNCIAPGPIDTELLNGVSREQIGRIVAQQVIARQFTPEAVCDVAQMILGPQGRSLSGQVFHIGGA
ncbi:MAG: SDR family NAD(P)-dependent oxidoreductase [Aquabacterium sp.]